MDSKRPVSFLSFIPLSLVGIFIGGELGALDLCHASLVVCKDLQGLRDP